MIRLNFLPMITFLGAFLFLDNGQLQAQEAKSYSPLPADKYGKRFGEFRSRDINKATKKLYGQAASAKAGEELSKYYEASNFNFFCPGNSLLVGIDSTYRSFDDDVDERHHGADRTFKFTCIFLEDEKDQLFIKKECQDSFQPTDNKNLKDGKSSCDKPNEWVHGLTGQRWFADTTNENDEKNDNKGEDKKKFQDDRLLKTHCCKLRDVTGLFLQSTAECRKSSFTAGQSFTFRCGEGMFIKKIETSFKEDKWDRSYSFECCKGIAAQSR